MRSTRLASALGVLALVCCGDGGTATPVEDARPQRMRCVWTNDRRCHRLNVYVDDVTGTVCYEVNGSGLSCVPAQKVEVPHDPR